ncbi:MAG: hypothetical protein HGA67_03435 [Candidatus Yonathbacteria bacterium]|nr:hypothetical protein [Candidatus Yonathbacteria bacterium]
MKKHLLNGTKALVPVVSVCDRPEVVETMLKNIFTAQGAEARGIFFLGSDIAPATFGEAFETVRDILRPTDNFFLGVGFPREHPTEARLHASTIGADALFLPELANGTDVCKELRDIVALKELFDEECFSEECEPSPLQYDIPIFGGIRLDQLPDEKCLVECVREVSPYVDVIVLTNLAGTAPPDMARVSAVRKTLADKPLAIMNGVTPRSAAHMVSGIGIDCILTPPGFGNNEYLLEARNILPIAKAVRNHNAVQH